MPVGISKGFPRGTPEITFRKIRGEVSRGTLVVIHREFFAEVFWNLSRVQQILEIVLENHPRIFIEMPLVISPEFLPGFPQEFLLEQQQKLMLRYLQMLLLRNSCQNFSNNFSWYFLGNSLRVLRMGSFSHNCKFPKLFASMSVIRYTHAKWALTEDALR